MKYARAGRVESARVATPPLSVPVPSVVAPLRNVTVPVGLSLFEMTVAVKVMDWPKADGLTEEASVVEVAVFGKTVVLIRMDTLPLM